MPESIDCGYSKYPRTMPLDFASKLPMAKLLLAILSLSIVGGAQAQNALPAASPVEPQPAIAAPDRVSPEQLPGGKVSLMRGVLKRVDPVHDQLLIHAFGGGDVRIAFDPRTQFFLENAQQRLSSIPAGSVVSIDTVIEGGKLFARSVRTGTSTAVELSSQVVRYDPTRSQLILRDPASPQNVTVRINPSTTVINRGQPASPQALADGMLVQVWFSPVQKAASRVEILAEPGNSFTFEGRVIAVDLRARVLGLSNDTDHSFREIAIGSLDASSLSYLREGAEVNIQAEFDGEHYNARAVAPVSHTP
jgi:hypothetical protein